MLVNLTWEHKKKKTTNQNKIYTTTTQDHLVNLEQIIWDYRSSGTLDFKLDFNTFNEC